jgi:tape measure domain-containing protein
VPDSNAKITGDFSGLINEAGKAAKALENMGSKAASLANPLKLVSRTMEGMITTLGRFGLAAQGLEAIGKSAVGMANGLLKGNAALEMTTISFTTLLGGASAAQDMIRQLTKFAANTPFNLPGLELATQRLLGAGYAAKDIVPMMTALGDSISALGGTQDQLNSLVYVFGQMRNEAKLNAGDIMQMANLGIPALQMLADHYGKTTSEIQQMIHDGLIPGKEAAAIFATEMEKKYGGMMAAQSKTFSGMISNLQDWATATTITLTKPLFEPAKQGLQNLLDFVQSPAGQVAIDTLTGHIQSGVDTIGRVFNEAVTPVKVFLAAFQGKEVDGIRGFDTLTGELATKLGILAGKIVDLYKTFSPLTIVIDVFKGLVTGGLQGGLDALEKHVVTIGKAFGLDLQPVIDWFNDTVVKNVIPTLKDWAKTFIDDWWPKIRDAVAFVWGKLGDFWTFVSTKIWPPFSDFLKWLGEQWGKVGKSIGDTWETTIKPALVHFWEYITNVLWPKLRDDVFPWIEKHVKPILETAFGIIADHIIPDLGKFVDLVLNHVIPALVGWWGVLFTLFNPFIETAGKLIGNLLGNTKDLKDPVSKVMDVFKNMADTFKTDVIPVLDRLASIMHTIWWLSGGWAVELAIGGLGGDWLTQKIDALEKAANPSQARLEQYMKDHPNYDPAAAGNAPKKAAGDKNWRGGLVEVGDAGMELIRTASNQLMLATRPMLLNLERGSQIYSNQQTMNMFKSLPASPQQIHNMYQTSNSSYGNSYSNSSTSNFNLNANMPVDLSNALQRYYRQQQFLYGK